jgi:hypothetical protein
MPGLPSRTGIDIPDIAASPQYVTDPIPPKVKTSLGSSIHHAMNLILDLSWQSFDY